MQQDLPASGKRIAVDLRDIRSNPETVFEGHLTPSVYGPMPAHALIRLHIKFFWQSGVWFAVVQCDQGPDLCRLPASINRHVDRAGPR
jgi:hypothetical protein